MNTRRSALLAAAIFLAIAIPVSTIRPLWPDEILQLIETRQTSIVRMIQMSARRLERRLWGIWFSSSR